MDASRLRIHCLLTGERLAITGPATKANGWTVPRDLFDVADLQGMMVAHVDTNEQGEEVLRRDPLDPTQLAMSKIIGVIYATTQELAPASFPLHACADSNAQVNVVLGNEVLPFLGMRASDKPCAQIDEVATPPTPPPGASQW